MVLTGFDRLRLRGSIYRYNQCHTAYRVPILNRKDRCDVLFHHLEVYCLPDYHKILLPCLNREKTGLISDELSKAPTFPCTLETVTSPLIVPAPEPSERLVGGGQAFLTSSFGHFTGSNPTNRGLILSMDT